MNQRWARERGKSSNNNNTKYINQTANLKNVKETYTRTHTHETQTNPKSQMRIYVKSSLGAVPCVLCLFSFLFSITLLFCILLLLLLLLFSLIPYKYSVARWRSSLGNRHALHTKYRTCFLFFIDSDASLDQSPQFTNTHTCIVLAFLFLFGFVFFLLSFRTLCLFIVSIYAYFSFVFPQFVVLLFSLFLLLLFSSSVLFCSKSSFIFLQIFREHTIFTGN